MKLYNLQPQDNGGVKVETVLTGEEMQFMLEFALVNLMAMGLVPNSIAKFLEEHKEEAQIDFLNNVNKDEIGQA